VQPASEASMSFLGEGALLAPPSEMPASMFTGWPPTSAVKCIPVLKNVLIECVPMVICRFRMIFALSKKYLRFLLQL
jgi:hypothetical protein